MQHQEICIERPASRRCESTATWRVLFEANCSLLAFVHERPELPLFVMRATSDDDMRTIALNEPRCRWLPSHFNRCGTQPRRAGYLRELMQKATNAQRLTLGQWFGFSDFFYPLGADEEGQLFLHGSHFLLEPLDWNALLERWAEHTGLSAASTEPEFVRFVTMALERPVLELDALRTLEQLCELFRPSILENGGIVEYLRAPWRPGPEEPHTALAIKAIAATSPEADPLRTRVETYQAEHAYRLLLKKWPEFERTTRENFGLLALSSELLGDVELRARAGALCHSIEQRFGVSCVVGAASGTMQNEPIVDRAVAALGRSLREKRGFVFYDEAHIAVPRLSYAEVARSTERLIAAFERVALGESMAFADDYVQTLLLWSNTRSAAVRHQLLVVLSQVTRTVQRRHVLSDEATDHLIDELCDRLERAGSTEQLIGEFKQALERLALFTANGSVATYCMNLERTLGYLKAHCTEPLRASRVARRAGLSLPTFSRVFKQATGTSFGRYLRGLRVARAEQLLKTTRLSGERIADLCGFKSHQNLIRSFKRITGHTPGEFRHRHARDDSGGNANKHEAQDAQLSAP